MEDNTETLSQPISSVLDFDALAQACYAHERPLERPFSLKLSGDNSYLCEFSACLSYRPKQDAVYYGCSQQGKHVLLRVFFRPGQAQAAAQELLDQEKAQGVELKQPPLPLLVNKATPQLAVHLLELQQPVATFAEQWASTQDPEQRQILLNHCMRSYAAMHNAGFKIRLADTQQAFIHKRHLYFISPRWTPKKSQPVAAKVSLDNLAYWLCQLDPYSDLLHASAFKLYHQLRHWDDAITLGQTMLSHCVQAERAKLLRKRLAQVFRSNEQFVEHSSRQLRAIWHRDTHFLLTKALLTRPEDLLSDAEVLKDRRNITAFALALAKYRIVVKRYHPHGLSARLTQALRENPAAHSWRAAHLFTFMGIPTAKPLAVVEYCHGPFKGRTYFAMHYLAGQNALDSIQGPLDDAGLNQLRVLFLRLKQARITHGNLIASNVVFADDRWHLLGLDYVKHHAHQRTFKRAFRRDIEQFLKNWNDQPKIKQQLAQCLRPLMH